MVETVVKEQQNHEEVDEQQPSFQGESEEWNDKRDGHFGVETVSTGVRQDWVGGQSNWSKWPLHSTLWINSTNGIRVTVKACRQTRVNSGQGRVVRYSSPKNEVYAVFLPFSFRFLMFLFKKIVTLSFRKEWQAWELCLFPRKMPSNTFLTANFQVSWMIYSWLLWFVSTWPSLFATSSPDEENKPNNESKQNNDKASLALSPLLQLKPITSQSLSIEVSSTNPLLPLASSLLQNGSFYLYSLCTG